MKVDSERFVALCEDIRLKGAGFAGGALAADGRVVHLAGYAVLTSRNRQFSKFLARRFPLSTGVPRLLLIFVSTMTTREIRW